jgi:hypothetical protein
MAQELVLEAEASSLVDGPAFDLQRGQYPKVPAMRINLVAVAGGGGCCLWSQNVDSRVYEGAGVAL